MGECTRQNGCAHNNAAHTRISNRSTGGLKKNTTKFLLVKHVRHRQTHRQFPPAPTSTESPLLPQSTIHAHAACSDVPKSSFTPHSCSSHSLSHHTATQSQAQQATDCRLPRAHIHKSRACLYSYKVPDSHTPTTRSHTSDALSQQRVRSTTEHLYPCAGQARVHTTYS